MRVRNYKFIVIITSCIAIISVLSLRADSTALLTHSLILILTTLVILAGIIAMLRRYRHELYAFITRMIQCLCCMRRNSRHVVSTRYFVRYENIRTADVVVNVLPERSTRRICSARSHGSLVLDALTPLRVVINYYVYYIIAVIFGSHFGGNGISR